MTAYNIQESDGVEPQQKKQDVNIEPYRISLQGSKNLEELKNNFLAMPADIKPLLNSLKDELKNNLK
jgi:hypothetical protein